MRNISTTGLDALSEGVEAIVHSGVVPGAVIVAGDAGEAHIAVSGVADIATGEPLQQDAIFRIQSMSKPIIAVAAMQLIERGEIALHDPVERWLPELANRKVLRTPVSELDDVVPAKRPITVEDLLTFRSGYGAMMFDQAQSPIGRAMEERHVAPSPVPHLIASDDWIARLAELPLIHQPGEGWRYHTSIEILSILVSRVTGAPLQDHLQEHLFQPLGMTDTGLFVPASERHRLPAGYERDEAGTLVEFEPAGGGYNAESPDVEMSHGEMVSTARDFHRFASMLMRGGELDGTRVLSEESVAQMAVDHIEPAQKTDDAFFPGFWETDSWGYGMGVTVAPDEFGEAGRCNWMGGLGTAWFNDPHTGLIGIFLSQVMLDEQLLAIIPDFYRAAYATRP